MTNDVRRDLDRTSISHAILRCEPSQAAKHKARIALIVGTAFAVGVGAVAGYVFGGPSLEGLLNHREFAPIVAGTVGGVAAGVIGAAHFHSVGKQIQEEDVRPKVKDATDRLLKRVRDHSGLITRKEAEAAIRDDVRGVLVSGGTSRYPASYAATQQQIAGASEAKVKANPDSYVVVARDDIARRVSDGLPERRRRAMEYLAGFMLDDEFAQSEAGHRVREELGRRGYAGMRTASKGEIVIKVVKGSELEKMFEL